MYGFSDLENNGIPSPFSKFLTPVITFEKCDTSILTLTDLELFIEGTERGIPLTPIVDLSQGSVAHALLVGLGLEGLKDLLVPTAANLRHL